MKTKNLFLRKFIIIFLLIIFLLPKTIYTANNIDLNNKGSLTLGFDYKGEKLGNVSVFIYKIANIGEDAKFKITDEFKDYPIDLNEIDSSSKWNATAQTLAAYISADNIKESLLGKTDENGLLRFSNLDLGLYLVISKDFKIGESTYKFAPFLISIPNLDENNNWKYNLLIKPKMEKNDNNEPPEYKVVKKWNDYGSEKERPKEIKVEILKDNKYYKTVILSEENNWTYSWEGERGSSYQVVERNIKSGYTVTIVKNENIFIITNNYRPEKPTEPTNPNKPTKPKESTESTDSTKPNSSTNPEDSTKPIERENLPKTGLLKWPIPILAGLGMVFLGVGLFLRSRDKK